MKALFGFSLLLCSLCIFVNISFAQPKVTVLKTTNLTAKCRRTSPNRWDLVIQDKQVTSENANLWCNNQHKALKRRLIMQSERTANNLDEFNVAVTTNYGNTKCNSDNDCREYCLTIGSPTQFVPECKNGYCHCIFRQQAT